MRYLLSIFPKHSEIVGCVVNDASPFGKKESFFQKAKKTYDIFGMRFFLYYSFKFIFNRCSKSKRLDDVLLSSGVPKISLNKPINHPESVRAIKDYNPDLLISILGNQIFKAPIIELAPKGCLNLHTALLPQYRGLMPTFWVMNNKESHTGVSVFFVDEGIDSGPIIVQEKVEIGNRTLSQLIACTKKLGMESIVKAVDLIHGDNVSLLENDNSKKTYFTFPTRADVKCFTQGGNKFF